jgi:hypothetical protein
MQWHAIFECPDSGPLWPPQCGNWKLRLVAPPLNVCLQSEVSHLCTWAKTEKVAQSCCSPTCIPPLARRLLLLDRLTPCRCATADGQYRLFKQHTAYNAPQGRPSGCPRLRGKNILSEHIGMFP